MLLTPSYSQETVIVTRANGIEELFTVYEDINFSSEESPHYLIFSQDDDLIEVRLHSDHRYDAWYFENEPAVDEFIEVLFPEDVEEYIEEGVED